MPDNQIRIVGRLPTASTAMVSFTRDFQAVVGGLALRYRFDRDGSVREAEIRFSNVRAYRERAEPYCTAWHVEGYDRVVEVVDSSWVAELIASTNTTTVPRWPLRHFLMYFDSEGAIEVVARDVELVADHAPRHE